MDAMASTESPAEELRELGRFLTALGDPARQQILLLLSRKRLNVGELAERFHLSRPAVSHHLKVLLHAGILVQERDGRERVYRVDATKCRRFVDRLRTFVATCCSGKACC
ncbi:MAG TPA: metalloregulator ArsR/SmtB family transcription factor [Candidatus Eisenbacteria bacterium]|nr:metalloregulator ArsR/SmtB family transcription factor [Candidatus Eisenbacteria bacterium]